MESNEKKLTLLLLCWLLGITGLHRFLAGKYLTGALQLLMAVFIALVATFSLEALRPVAAVLFFSLFVWVIVDFILILISKFTDRQGLYVTRWV